MVYRVDVRIEGIRPLLQHRFPDEGELEKPSKKRTGNPLYDAVEKSLYRLADGVVYQPAEHIERALVKAAAGRQIAGRRKKTYKDLVNSSVFVSPAAIPHVYQKWVVDSRAVVVPATRGRVVRQRPRLDKWALEFCVEVRDEQMPVEVLKLILDDAGNSVGIGDYRPRFGLFMVTRFDAHTEEEEA